MFSTPLPTAKKRRQAKLGLVIIVTALGLFALWQNVREVAFSAVMAGFAQISVWQWIAAGLTSLLSFAALGRYDDLWHRALKTGVAPQTARRTGMMAIAIGQTLGMASCVAGLVRWHRLPDLRTGVIVQLSAAVSLSFMICWGIIALPALWWLSGAALPPLWSIALILGPMIWAGRRICCRHGIAPGMALRLLGWTCLDLSAAALVLYIALPGSVPVFTLIAAVIIAMGAGLISNTPGGVGTFDLALIALLPNVAPEALITALLAYRLVYMLVPFTLAAALLVHPVLQRKSTPPDAPASWGLGAQSGAVLGQSTWAAFMGHTALGPIAIGAPRGPMDAWAKTLPAVYKCDQRSAQRLRQRGWAVARIAVEARLNPQRFCLSGRKFQSLRRKLRKAQSTQVTIRAGHPRMDEAAVVAKSWAKAHGGELGFSMGRFAPALIAKQRVFLILQDHTLKGFITFHQSPTGWALDLIRYTPDLPDGAMQAAMVTALEAAKDAGVTSLCLGAVPSFDQRFARLNRKRAGLAQFKRSFAPTWHPVYHAARTPFWFALSAAAVTFAIQRPFANLRYQPAIINFMQAFHLPKSRARGIAGPITTEPDPNDECADTSAEIPRLALG